MKFKVGDRVWGLKSEIARVGGPATIRSIDNMYWVEFDYYKSGIWNDCLRRDESELIKYNDDLIKELLGVKD